MNGLEQTFYIMAIVYMGVMFIIMIAIVVAVFAIKAKVHAIQQHIEEKFAAIANIIEAGGKAASAVKKVVTRGL